MASDTTTHYVVAGPGNTLAYSRQKPAGPAPAKAPPPTPSQQLLSGSVAPLSVDVAVDPTTGNPCVSFLKKSGGKDTGVYVACLDTTWSFSKDGDIETLAGMDAAGHTTRLRVDSAGKLHLIYQVQAGSGATLRYAMCSKP